MKRLARLSGVLLAPRASLRRVVFGGEGRIGDVLLLLLVIMFGTAPLEMAVIFSGADRGIGMVLSRTADMYMRFALVPLVVCGVVGLVLVGLVRFVGRRVPIDAAIAAALYLWVPVGVLGLLGEMLFSFGLDLPVLPHVPVAFFLRGEPALWLILLRAAVSYGWSAALVWVLFKVLLEDGRKIAPVAPRWGGLVLGGWILLSYLAGGVAVAANYDRVRPIRPNDPAIDFELPGTDGGGKLSLSSKAGQPLVLEFWATWCSQCVSSMPQLDAWAAAHSELRVLAIHSGGNLEEVRQFVAERGWKNISFLVDESEQTTQAYRVDTFPSVFVVGPDGRIVDGLIGPPSASWLDARIAEARQRR